jgi:hypothetical protein
MTNMAARLAKLEKANPAAVPPRATHLVVCNVGESVETAIARWRKEHPDEPQAAYDDDLIDLIILQAVSPLGAEGTVQ